MFRMNIDSSAVAEETGCPWTQAKRAIFLQDTQWEKWSKTYFEQLLNGMSVQVTNILADIKLCEQLWATVGKIDNVY